MTSRLKFLSGLVAATSIPSIASASVPVWNERVLWLARQGTTEEVRVPFCRDGYHIYLPGYQALCWILRDHKVDPSLGYVNFSINTIEALWEIQQTIIAQGVNRPLVITSGYRTLETNSHIDHAAHNSQHLYGTAVDMYVEGISMRQLYNDCYSRAISGGIGYYEDHIHLDTGSRRYWVGSLDDSLKVHVSDIGSLKNLKILSV